MSRIFLNDERGAISIDWVTLTAGVLALAIVVVCTVMMDSTGYVISALDELNDKYQLDAIDVTALGQQIDLNR